MNKPKMQKITVRGIRYGYKVGTSFIAVKTYANRRHPETPKLSFIIPWSAEDRRSDRSAILEKLAQKAEAQ